MTDTVITLPCPLDGVSQSAWERFVRACAIGKRLGAVTTGNAIGLFAMRPRRLGDLGLIKDLRRTQPGEHGPRAIWIGRFVDAAFGTAFFRRFDLQYEVFCKSVRDHAEKLAAGELRKPAALTLSGALAVLHRAGAGALDGRIYPETARVVEACNGIF